MVYIDMVELTVGADAMTPGDRAFAWVIRLAVLLVFAYPVALMIEGTK